MSKIKVFWVTNQIFPDISIHMGMEPSFGGGWMYGLANSIKNSSVIELHVATAYKIPKLVNEEINGINYYVLPTTKSLFKYNKKLEATWKTVINKVQPDVVHIHGTEYAHGLALINSCPDINYVVSIQGMLSVCKRYYHAGLSNYDIIKAITLRDILKRDTIFSAKRKFVARGKIELDYIKKVKHIIGRTDWDLAHTKAINPKATYHFCNEVLRENFYAGNKWAFKAAEKNTIFLSQAGYPIKGLHQVLSAVSLVKKQLPDIKIKIAGDNIVKSENLVDKIKRNGYANLIIQRIKKYDLSENVVFLGVLDEHEMKQAYLSSNVFICPSSIENSPNSLGEAQLLGVPSIASYVGGVPNMINHGISGLLYRFEEIEVLAHYILQVLNSEELCTKLSLNGIIEATKRHSQQHNVEQMVSIYKAVNETS